MKQITITVPDNCELKQDGNTYIVVEKEKKLTYEDIAKRLFEDNLVYYVDECGMTSHVYSSKVENPNHCTSKKQAQKLLAINQLMNVAKYLNGDWQPNWDNFEEHKYYIITYTDNITIQSITGTRDIDVYFKSRELAKQAMEVLGEDVIRLALCTDY